MTHPPNSYHYQPATDFESQESEHMYQQSHSMHMSQPYEGGQRGGPQASHTGHQRRNNSLATQAQPSAHHPHHTNGNGMLYYYDWKNFPMTQAPGSFIPSPEEANMHGQGPMSTSTMGPMSPYHPFASSNSQFMPPPPQPSSTSSSSSSPPSSSMPQPSAAYGGMAIDPALSAPSMNAPNFMPGPSPNFNNNSMSYNFIPALPPPFGEQYFSNHHRTASSMDVRNNGNVGEPLSYSAMYQSPSSMHFSNSMHSSRLASPPAPGFPSQFDGEYYAPALPYHPMMMSHASNLHFQHASRSASPSVAYSTSASPSPSHYSQGPSSSFACHPFSRPSLPPGNSSMNGSSGPRLACRPCIRGHRAPSCKHTDRPLFAIRPRGRPSSQCVHCKEARKTGGIHVKCLCGSTSPSSKSNSMAYGSPTSPDIHKSGGMVSAEPSLKMDSVYTASSPPPPQQHSYSTTSKMAANKSALAAVMQSFWSGINSSESASHSQESDSASESASCETNFHRRTLSVEATDTVSQKPPEAVQSVDFHMSENEHEREHEREPESMHSQCMCNLGMACLCSSKSEKLPKHAEPASITNSLHQHPHHDSSQSRQRVLHSSQPMDPNSYEYHRLNAFHEAAAMQQHSEHDQQDENEENDESEELSFSPSHSPSPSPSLNE